MAKSASEIVYSSNEDCKDYLGWVIVMPRRIKMAKNVLDKEATYAFNCMEYLLDGCLIKTQNPSHHTGTERWDIKVLAETRQGLEKVTEKLTLPLE